LRQSENIPIRHIHATLKEPGFSESFSIRDVHGLLEGKDMDQELHRHDFFLYACRENRDW